MLPTVNLFCGVFIAHASTPPVAWRARPLPVGRPVHPGRSVDLSPRFRLRHLSLGLPLPVVVLEGFPSGRRHEAPHTLDRSPDHDRPGRFGQLQPMQPGDAMIEDSARFSVERTVRRVFPISAPENDGYEPPGVIMHAWVGVAKRDLM